MYLPIGEPVAPDVLRDFSTAVCRHMGAKADVAAEVADHLVDADLAGHPSHGVMRLTQYVDEWERGDLAPQARPRLVRDGPGAALFDAARGFGHFSTMVACQWAAAQAERQGVAIAAVRHSGHTGRLGTYAEYLARRGLVAIVLVGAAGHSVGAAVLPGTSTRFLAANPWAIGIPAERRAPVVVDVSTTMLAEGKITVARENGQPLPPGCIVNADARDGRDPEEYFNGGGLLPLGGHTAGHKGFGLGLAAALIGSLAMIGDPEPTLAGSQIPTGADPRGRAGGVAVIAVNPTALGDGALYAHQVAQTATAVGRAAGDASHIQVPGDPEAAARQRQTHGIRLADATHNALEELGTRLGIATGYDRMPSLRRCTESSSSTEETDHDRLG
ncbi:Ldh family oxidoreductase [Streptomyces sp. NPDC015350]|uniref:Ldh family oxidoreductase n=1 Tax=Streptomyces sp. NPDC015350 TaxID=3364955 RepID=UPI0036FB538D